jgi:preprotein translocase subunit SecD
MKPRFTLWLIILLILGALYASLPQFSVPLNIKNLPLHLNKLGGNFPLKLGLDLQGGTQLVLETDMSKIDPVSRDKALASATDVIERRVNLYGVSEAVIQASKLGDQRRILVDMPGVTDASAAADLVGKTAQLEFREIPASPSAKENEATKSGLPAVYLARPTGLTGADLKSAEVVFNQSTAGNTGSPQVSIRFTDDGAKKFASLTKRNIGRAMPIFLDGQPLSAPVVQQEIVGGSAVITGQFTTAEAKNLVTQLNAGALPVPIHIIDQRLIGATLGQQSVSKSVIAGVIGLLTVMIFMIVYYGFFGVIADMALIIYALFVMVIFRTGLFLLPPVTLTLAGIAGFILSIGMAVDANILIFERMKEEKRWGKSSQQALELGFKRAWTSIRDSNISSLITASILYYIGTGLVKGFAITLAIGVLVSMFTAIVVTRTILRMIIKK